MKCKGCGCKFKRRSNRQKYCCKLCTPSEKRREEYSRDFKKDRPERLKRWCLRCNNKFNALGRFNRICNFCNRLNG